MTAKTGVTPEERHRMIADVEKLDGLKLSLRTKLDELRERGDQVSEKSAASGRACLE